MTKEQFLDIETKLAKWREERGLSVEDQMVNFEVNYTKELLEFFEAHRENNEYEMIDAICDMCVVCINAGAVFSIDSYETSFKIPCYQKRYEPKDSDLQALYTDLLRPLYDYATTGNRLRKIGIYPLFLQLEVRGYDPYLCLCETIKELNSRTGKWDKKEGKWIKDIGAYTPEEAKNIAIQKFIIPYPKEFDMPSLMCKGDENQWWWHFQSSGIQVKKWYKADYSKCKIEE